MANVLEDLSLRKANSGLAVARFFASHKDARGTSSATRSPRVGSLTAQPLVVDQTSSNFTGLHPWWSYSVGNVPGVGRYFINTYGQNLLLQADDVDIPYRGMDLAFRRAYNSWSQHDYVSTDGSTEIGQYGNGWTNTLDVHMSTNNCPNTGYSWAGFYGFSVFDADGSRYDYCFNSSGVLVPPPGMQGTTLVANPDGGSFFWTRKNGTSYMFYSPYYGGTNAALSGRIYQMQGRNKHNYIQFNYYWNGDASSSANLTQIVAAADCGCDQLVLKFSDFSGRRLLSELDTPSGAAIYYGYDASGNLSNVYKPGPNGVTATANETYAGYHSNLVVTSPRWNATYNASTNSATEGGYMAFSMDGALSAQTNGIQWVGVMNPAAAYLNDGTGMPLQSSISTGPMQYRHQDIYRQSYYTYFSDTDGHFLEQVIQNPPGFPTTLYENTGTQWLTSSETWDANYNNTSLTDQRGNRTDYAYDLNGNVVAVAKPSVATSVGSLRPTKLYDYDSSNNITANCDETEVHASGADWSSGFPAADNLCSSLVSAPHWTTVFTSQAYEPYGEISRMTSPLGYTKTFAYETSRQSGLDYGLPTTITGSTITQVDNSQRTPTSTFWYGPQGRVACYNDGQATSVFSYDVQGRLLLVADGDDSSANASSVCGKTSGQPSWNTQKTFTYNSDGTRASSQTPSERALGLSTTYSYDFDGNPISISQHNGCVSASGCAAGVTRVAYDGADRMIEIIQPSSGSETPSFNRYLYDLTSGGSASAEGGISVAAHGNQFATQHSTVSHGVMTVHANAFDGLDRVSAEYRFVPCPVSGSSGETSCSQNAVQWSYTWDTALGQLGSIAMPNNVTESFAYDALGRQTTVQFTNDPNATPSRSVVYDPSGRLAQLSDSATGSPYTYSYDSDGGLIATTEPGSGTRMDYGLYPDGLRRSMSVTSTGFTQSNFVTYTYQADELLASIRLNKTVNTRFSGAVNPCVFQASYTAGGRQTSSSDCVTGTSTTSTYDQLGRLSGTALPQGQYSGMSFDAEDNLTSYKAFRGQSFARAINIRGEMLSEIVSPNVLDSSGAPAYESFTLQSDQGVLHSAGDAWDARTGAILQHGGQGFSYDLLGRQATNTSTYDSQNQVLAAAKSRSCDAGSDIRGGLQSATYNWGAIGHPSVVTRNINQSLYYTALHWDGDSLAFEDATSFHLQDLAEWSNISDPNTFGVLDRDFMGGVVGRHNSSGVSPWTQTDPYHQLCTMAVDRQNQGNVGFTPAYPIVSQPWTGSFYDGVSIFSGVDAMEPLTRGSKQTATREGDRSTQDKCVKMETIGCTRVVVGNGWDNFWVIPPHDGGEGCSNDLCHGHGGGGDRSTPKPAKPKPYEPKDLTPVCKSLVASAASAMKVLLPLTAATGNEWTNTLYYSKQQNLYFVSPPAEGTPERSSPKWYNGGVFQGYKAVGDNHTHPIYVPGLPDQFSSLDRSSEASLNTTFPGYTSFLGFIDPSGNAAMFSLSASGTVRSLGNPTKKGCK